MSPGFLERLFRGTPPDNTAALDQLVVRQLRGLGADLSKPRHVRHFLYFEHERDARAAAGEIEEADYDVSVEAPDGDEPYWTVVGEGYRVVGADTVAGYRAFFEQVAERHHGEYDGWEPAAKPQRVATVQARLFTRKKVEPPERESALPGRDTPIDPGDSHVVLGTPLTPPFPEGYEQIVVGMGCFWGADAPF